MQSMSVTKQQRLMSHFLIRQSYMFIDNSKPKKLFINWGYAANGYKLVDKKTRKYIYNRHNEKRLRFENRNVSCEFQRMYDESEEEEE